MLIVDLLKRARHIQEISGGRIGMCGCIKVVCDMHFLYYDSIYCIERNIPAFNAWNFTGKRQPPYHFWWPLSDKESRLKAFDTLIMLYENSDKEWH